jgi:hypothetical protein
MSAGALQDFQFAFAAQASELPTAGEYRKSYSRSAHFSPN